MRNKDDLDLLLDSALTTYGEPGPDAGLEHRVLVALSAIRHPDAKLIVRAAPRRSWRSWAIAIPLAACLLLLWFAASKSGYRAPSQPQQAREIGPPPISAEAKTPPVARRAGAIHRARGARSESTPQVTQAVALPKLDVFPTPQPLTAAEKGLAVVAAQAPRQELRALLEAQREDALSFSVADAHMPSHEPPTFVETQHP